MFFDFFKCQIRSLSIEYCIHKSRQNKAIENSPGFKTDHSALKLGVGVFGNSMYPFYTMNYMLKKSANVFRIVFNQKRLYGSYESKVLCFSTFLNAKLDLFPLNTVFIKVDKIKQ